jgi:hypothetical protein
MTEITRGCARGYLSRRRHLRIQTPFLTNPTTHVHVRKISRGSTASYAQRTSLAETDIPALGIQQTMLYEELREYEMTEFLEREDVPVLKQKMILMCFVEGLVHIQLTMRMKYWHLDSSYWY